MILQTSGPMSLQQVNIELKQIATATISLNDADVRKLLGKHQVQSQCTSYNSMCSSTSIP